MDEMDKPVITRRDWAKLFLFYAIATGACVLIIWVSYWMGDPRVILSRAWWCTVLPLAFGLLSRYLYLTARCAWGSWSGQQCPVTAEPGSRYCRAHNPTRGF